MRAALIWALLLALPAAGQSPTATNQIVGLVQNPLAVTPDIVLRDVDDRCGAPAVLCSPTALGSQMPDAGGTAYDPSLRAAWHTDGSSLVLVTIDGCQTLCSTTVVPLLRGGTITGLALDAAGQRLFQLETAPSQMALVSHDVSGCSVQNPQLLCTRQLGPQESANALAYDPRRDLVYVAVAAAAANQLVVLRADSGCAPVCTPMLRDCQGSMFASPITGLGSDPCTGSVTAAIQGQFLTYQGFDPFSCVRSMNAAHCCAIQTNRYRGLAIVPGWPVRSFGSSCTRAPCPSCGAMSVAPFGGDAVPGNPRFGMVLDNAPPQSLAWFFLGFGSCGTGVSLPVLCGPFWPNPGNPYDSVGPLAVAGAATCGGTVRVGLPVPNSTVFCGQVVCAQFLLVCPGVGVGVSHGLELGIGGR